jgi:hypothetical protein
MAKFWLKNMETAAAAGTSPASSPEPSEESPFKKGD